MANLDTNPYKGVRDFYPEDKYVQKWMFNKLREVVESFGYVEYDASPLEPAELYKAKSGKEIVNEQTYTFTDRGDREVTLRPEMTPTVARMVAGKRRDLAFPLRWYSIPNLFRYERPQKGRLREHYQLNVDIFGEEGVNADVEILLVSSKILKAFGAKDSDFEIRVSNRKLLNEIYEKLGLDDEGKNNLSKLLDKKAKMEDKEYKEKALEILGSNEKISELERLLEESVNSEYIKPLIDSLNKMGVENIKADISIVRGFDYYNGMVFEVYDTNPENNRSMFGGGRYDGLTKLFENENIPAIGFGMGDVTLLDFLKSRDLAPKYKSSADLFIATIEEIYIEKAEELAEVLREKGLNVEINIGDKKIGDQIGIADKKDIPYVLVLGEEEMSSKVYKVKKLESGEEKELSLDDIPEFVRS